MRTRRVIRSLGVLALTSGATSVALAQSAQPEGRSRADTGRGRVVVRRGEPIPRRESERLTRRGRLPDATAEASAAAYRDTRARELISRARRARFEQDSTLTSYDATVKQRLSAGLRSLPLVRVPGRADHVS